MRIYPFIKLIYWSKSNLSIYQTYLLIKFCIKHISLNVCTNTTFSPVNIHYTYSLTATLHLVISYLFCTHKVLFCTYQLLHTINYCYLQRFLSVLLNTQYSFFPPLKISTDGTVNQFWQTTYQYPHVNNPRDISLTKQAKLTVTLNLARGKHPVLIVTGTPAFITHFHGFLHSLLMPEWYLYTVTSKFFSIISQWAGIAQSI